MRADHVSDSIEANAGLIAILGSHVYFLLQFWRQEKLGDNKRGDGLCFGLFSPHRTVGLAIQAPAVASFPSQQISDELPGVRQKLKWFRLSAASCLGKRQRADQRLG